MGDLHSWDHVEDLKTFVTFGSIEQPEFAAKLPDFITQVSVLERQKPNGPAADSDQEACV